MENRSDKELENKLYTWYKLTSGKRWMQGKMDKEVFSWWFDTILDVGIINIYI